MKRKVEQQTALFILITLTFSFCLLGEPDYLEPVTPSGVGIVEDYMKSVNSLLSNGFNKKPLARYIVHPAFAPEYAFSVEQDKRGGYKIIVNVLSNNYWYAENKRTMVFVKTTEKVIDKEFAVKISVLFKTAIIDSLLPESDSGGLDGIQYYFSTTGKDGDVVTGTKWSPKEPSLIYKLMKVSEDLISFACGEKNGKTEDVLIKDIDSLFLALSKRSL